MSIDWFGSWIQLQDPDSELPGGTWTLLYGPMRGGLTSCLRCGFAELKLGPGVAVTFDERTCEIGSVVERVRGQLTMTYKVEFAPERSLSMVLCEAADIVLARGEDIVLSLDDLHRVGDDVVLISIVESFHQLQKHVRELCMRGRRPSGRVVVVVASRKDLWTIWRQQDQPSELFHDFRERWLRPFSSKETRDLLDAGLRSFGMSLQDDLAARIFAYTGGHPALTQRMGWVMAEALLNRADPTEAIERERAALLESSYFMQAYDIVQRDRAAREVIEDLIRLGTRGGSVTDEATRGLYHAGVLAYQDGRLVIVGEIARDFLRSCLTRGPRLFSVKRTEWTSCNREGGLEHAEKDPGAGAPVRLCRYEGHINVYIQRGKEKLLPNSSGGKPVVAVAPGDAVIVALTQQPIEHAVSDRVCTRDGARLPRAQFEVAIEQDEPCLRPEQQPLAGIVGRDGEQVWFEVSEVRHTQTISLQLFQARRLVQVLTIVLTGIENAR